MIVAVPTKEPPRPENRHYQPYGAALALMRCRDDEVLLSGPAGCVAPETRIYDPFSGLSPTIAQLHAGRIAPWVMTLAGPRRAGVPFIKGVANLYRIKTASGRSCLVTLDHKMLTPAGWKKVAFINNGDSVLSDGDHPSPFSRQILSASFCRHPSTEERYLSTLRTDDRRCLRKPQDSQFDCQTCPCFCGEQPHSDQAVCRDEFPSRVDALGRSRDDPRSDAPVISPGCIHPHPQRGLRATRGYSPCVDETASCRSCAFSENSPPCCEWCRSVARSRTGTDQPLPTPELARCADSTRSQALHRLGECHSFSEDSEPGCAKPQRQIRSEVPSGSFRRPQELADIELQSDVYSPSCITSKFNYTDQWDTVQQVVYERTGVYLDLHVPGEEHYLAEGLFHHNTGKSRACLEKLHLCAEKYPGMRGMIVRKTRESLTQSALVTWEDKVVPAGHAILTGALRSHRQSYHYPNGSEVVLVGMDKASKVMSTEFDVIYCQEAIELVADEWEKLTTRLRNSVMPYQQMIADTNPDAPTHWLKRRCDMGRTRMLDSRHEDNPAVTPGYLAKLDALTGARLQRLRHGKWVQAEGVVYDGWDRFTHLIDRFPIPAEWPRFWTVDFGFTSPFVWQAWAKDPDGRLFRYREIYATQQLVEDHARHILSLTVGEPRPRAIICDHDREDRATLERHLKMATIPAQKAIAPGIQAVASRLRKAGDGKPRLFYLRDSLVERDQRLEESRLPCCSEEEMDCYIWKIDATVKKGEEPVDKDNHGMDAMRYMVAHFDLVAKRELKVWT